MAGEMSYGDYMRLWYYGLKPSWVIAVTATFLFSCATLVHLVLLFRLRAFFAFPLIVGSLCTSCYDPNLFLTFHWEPIFYHFMNQC